MPTIQAFDINKELQNDMSKFTQTTLCLPVVASYTAAVKVIDALVGPVALMKQQIIYALDNNDVTKALTEISKTLSIINSNIGVPTLQISASTMAQMNIFSRICVDFDDILPNAMKKLMDTATDAIDSFVSDGIDDLIYAMPDEISDMIDDGISDLKDNALSSALSDAANAILAPLTMYRAYIQSCGLTVMLKQLQKFEKCLTNSQGCNRPTKEVCFPGTTKFNSQYYMDLLAINLKGELQIAKLCGQVKGIEMKMSKAIEKLDTYKTPIQQSNY
jgi:hypothetical protein